MLLGIGVFAVALVLAAGQAHALRVTMKRVIFEGGKRSEVITIINNSAETETYRMGWRRMKMTPDRSLITLKDDEPAPELNPADSYVRFSPRRITIEPGRAQQIRLMVRYPKDLPDGEYRSHFWIHPEADAIDFDDSLAGKKDENAQAIVIKMLTGITMPVFIRKGKLSYEIGIEDLAVKQNGGMFDISYKLTRSGTMSFYGDVDIECTGGSADLSLRQIRGVAVYTEVDHRMMTHSISAPDGGLQACPSVRLSIRESDGKDGVVKVSQVVPVQR